MDAGHAAPRRHDRRRADPVRRPATGYFPGGSWEYRRTLEIAGDDTDVVVLGFEGVYRDAVVSVNGTSPPTVLTATRTSSYPSTTAAPRSGERAGRGAGPRGRPLVLGRRHLPERVAPPGGPGAPRSGRRSRCAPPRSTTAVPSSRLRATCGTNRPPTATVDPPRWSSSTPTARSSHRRRAGDHVPAATSSTAASGCSSPTRSAGASTTRTSTRARSPLLDDDDRRRRGVDRRSASGRSRSTPNGACGSTASRCSCGAPASTTTTGRSARRRSTAPRSVGSSC